MAKRKKNENRENPLIAAQRKKPALRRAAEIAKRVVRDIAIGVTGAAIVVGLWLVFELATTEERFVIKQVAVTGNTYLSGKQVALLAGQPLGKNIVLYSLRSAAMALKEHPWVRSVELRRDFPDRIDIMINERRPDAVVRAADGTYWWADPDGTVLVRAGEEFLDSEGNPKAPYLAGLVNAGSLERGSKLYSPEFIAGYRTLKYFSRVKFPGDRKIATVTVDDSGRTEVAMTDGMKVYMAGTGKYDEKMAYINTIRQIFEHSGGKYPADGINYIDMTVRDKVVVKYF